MRALALVATVILVAFRPAQKLSYDTEYPVIGYSTTVPTGAIARLHSSLASGEVVLEAEAERGYLKSLLSALEIPVDSQVLVFSKTSFQVGLISPETPRAIYFNDDTYVAWVQDGPNLEIAAVDPSLGAVFYTLKQEDVESPRFERKTVLCLRCHDSTSISGGGVPRFLMGSGVTDASGRLAYHEGWTLTTDETPIEKRWGGWYVTGTGAGRAHLGNRTVTPATTGPVEVEIDLASHVDTTRYLGRHSDVVALMVLEHQVHVQNVLVRVSWDLRVADGASPIEPIVEPLVKALLFAGEAPLTGPIAGSSGFRERFSRRGPRDSRGRSLRELDLVSRLFRYPCSYLIYSEAFDALPETAKKTIYRRLRDVLDGTDTSEAFAHLSSADRKAILEILEETKSDLAAEVR